MKRLLWGCPGMNFKYTLPFHIMRQAYEAFEKRPPWLLQPYLETLKCYQKRKVINDDFFKTLNCYDKVNIMKDGKKTKKQLVVELESLRQRVTELEALEKESKKAEQVLRETNTFLKNILDSSSSISIISTDLEGNVLFWNKGAENIFGYKTNEMVGQRKIDILYGDDETKRVAKELSESLLKKKKGVSCEIIEDTKNGRKLCIHLTLSPRFGERGKIVGILGIGEDITERIQAEEALRNS